MQHWQHLCSIIKNWKFREVKEYLREQRCFCAIITDKSMGIVLKVQLPIRTESKRRIDNGSD